MRQSLVAKKLRGIFFFSASERVLPLEQVIRSGACTASDIGDFLELVNFSTARFFAKRSQKS